MLPKREFHILNPNGMKDAHTLQAQPTVEAIVAAMEERNWHIEDGMYVAVQVDGYRWFPFTVTVETKKTYVGTPA